MTYIQHLFNWNRVKAAIWVFGGGVIAMVVANLSTLDILTVTKTQLVGIVFTAIITQLTKALNNYTKELPKE